MFFASFTFFNFIIVFLPEWYSAILKHQRTNKECSKKHIIQKREEYKNKNQKYNVEQDDDV